MDFYVIILRIFHILSGAMWAGASFALTWFVAPAVAAVGPDGGKVVRELVLRTRWVAVISSVAGLTVLSGLLLYWRDSGGLRIAWITTGTGIMFTIGGIAGLVAMFFGTQVGMTSSKLANLGERIAQAGGPPSPEEGAELGRLQGRMQSLGSMTAIALVIALLAMASARYVVF